MTVPFSISTSTEGNLAQVALAGEVDLAAVPTVRDQVDACLLGAVISDVVIDLSEVTFLDSSGISVLIGCLRQAREAGKALRVINIEGRAKEVLDMTGVTSLLTDGTHA